MIQRAHLILNLALNRYESVVIGNGLANQVSNPDVDVDITKPDIVIRSQIAALKEMTSWLKAAYSGNDISFDNGEGARPTPEVSCSDLIFQFLTSGSGAFLFVDEDGSGGEESGSGCDTPDCDADRDIYFSTPPNPGKPRVNQVVVSEKGSSAASQGSMALALCGLVLALLTPHLR